MDSYDEVYRKSQYYWGKKPNGFCCDVVGLVSPSRVKGSNIIDLGSGEGRDLVYFALMGMNATGVDVSAPGLEKAQKWASREGLNIRTLLGNLNSYSLDMMYDVVYSSGSLTYIREERRREVFENYKSHTVSKGLNAFNAFVLRQGIETPPDWGKDEHFFMPGELASYYADWEIIISSEEVFDCKSSGIPHRHAMETLIARKA